MEKYSCYQYTLDYKSGMLLDGSTWMGWIYEIYNQDRNPELIRESDEWFESEERARFAAIGHIDLLENGEG